jgi:taurine dioxygenase
MKFTIHSNGWTVLCEDIDLAQATQDEINQIAEYVSSNTLVIARKQSMTAKELVKLGKLFGNLRNFNYDISQPHRSERVKAMMVPDGDNYIQRVTGEKDANGLPGVFGNNNELIWHCNSPVDPNRAPVVCLYGVRDTKGSVTSWANGINFYNDLSVQDKTRLETLSMNLINSIELVKFWNGQREDVLKNHPEWLYSSQTPWPLIKTTDLGQRGIYYPRYNIKNFVNYTEEESEQLCKWIDSIYLTEKYIYNHYWEDGDILFAEQWLGIHRRPYYNDMEHRVLWRFTTDFSKSLGKINADTVA